MAFALQFDGINDYVSIPSWSASGDFDISGSFTTPATIGTQIILGSSSSNNHFLATFAGGSLQARINGTNLTPAITGLVGSTTYDYTLVRVGSSVTLTVTGVGSQGYTNAGTFVLDAFGRYGSGLYFSGQIPGTLTMIGSGGTRTYDFNQSTGSVLPDTTSSQDGTLTNFPTDDSQWVDIGGGATCVTTGTAVPTQTEADVVTGGKTIILTLTGDTWVASGATFDAQRQNIIDGLDSAQSELTGWNNEVRDKEVVGAVVRTSDTIVTITLTASAAYDITATETITATVPATALVTSASAVISAPTFTVTATATGISVPVVMNHLRNQGIA